MNAPLIRVPCKTGCGAMTRTRKPKPGGNSCFACWLKERGQEIVTSKGEDGSLILAVRKVAK